MTNMFGRIAVMLAFCVAATSVAQQQHTTEAPSITEGPQPMKAQPALMNNDSVLKMHAAGLSDDLILQTISAQPGRYETDPDSLIALKKAGLSDEVLTAMTNKARRQLTNVPTEPIDVSPVNEIGVYYKDSQGRWVLMDSEAVHVKSGGFVKSTLTHNIVKEDRNGVVSGRESKLLLPRPIEFLIYTGDGVTAAEYELLRFRLNSKDREFRVLTGGVFHSTGGAQRDEVPFTPVKIAPRTWTFKLGQDTPGAEYGILPPGTGHVTNGGKIYTFAISE